MKKEKTIALSAQVPVPISKQIQSIASSEQRTLSQTIRILLLEALAARTEQKSS